MIVCPFLPFLFIIAKMPVELWFVVTHILLSTQATRARVLLTFFYSGQSMLSQRSCSNSIAFGPQLGYNPSRWCELRRIARRDGHIHFATLFLGCAARFLQPAVAASRPPQGHHLFSLALKLVT